MQGIKCPFCGKTVYSACFPNPGKVDCVYCGRQFFVGYDELKHAWIAVEKSSPIQAIFIQGKKKG